MVPVNSHIHTPYSFSAFKSLEEAFLRAYDEGIKVLGINDFFVTDGFSEFNRLAHQYTIYPLFNIEFVGLLKREQKQNIRVNDPANPGRTYFCGKGLDYPVSFSTRTLKQLNNVIKESQQQIREMMNNVNALLQSVHAPFRLSYEEIRSRYAKELVRERHIAKALRVMIVDAFGSEEEKRTFLTLLYGGKPPKANLTNINAFENELRSRLLKAGGAVFVPEDEHSFLPVSDLIRIIIDGGGIPCYPVLLDDPQGHFTEFEQNPELLFQHLTELGVRAVEFIPGRNDINILRKFVRFLNERNLLITFGTEHNTPEMLPMKVTARGGVKLDDFLLQVNFEGASVLAAHQQLRREGKEGYLDANGRCKTAQKENFIRMGSTLINRFLNQID
ncbi:MAG: hypothetical protein J7L89_03865 [Bacteroidales bacterium]|nr:hypothetical protein [Bacteroidales bacterium]